MITFKGGPDGDFYDVQCHVRVRRIKPPRLRIVRPVWLTLANLTRLTLRLRRLILALILLLAALLQLLAMLGYHPFS